jgi:tRNA G18 (ribose-2'-O)-methylase SpoU
MRGYFGIGVEGVSKAANAGALMRTAHAFGAGFVFTIAPTVDVSAFRQADTSDTANSVPLYTFPDVGSVLLPRGCVLVGVELNDEAVDLPSFRHPRRAAYVLGGERRGLTRALAARCAFTVKIPTRFSINLALAGALVMYDRMLAFGRFAPRPEMPGGPAEALAPHRHGLPKGVPDA